MKVFLFLILLFCLAGCTKQYPHDAAPDNPTNIIVKATISDNSGNAVNVFVSGTYTVNVAMNSSNYVSLQIHATQNGIAVLGTDTVNGVWFRDSVLVKNTGDQLISLMAHGNPVSPIHNTFFTLNGDSTNTSFAVNPDEGVPVINRDDYYPNTFWSNWVTFVSGDLSGDSIRATNKMATKSGKTYQYFEYINPIPSGKDSVFIRKAGGSYYQYGNGNKILGPNISSSDPYEFIFLKDNVPSGTQWTTDIHTGALLSGTSFNEKYRFTVLNSDTSFNIGTLHFPHVIIVQTEWMPYNNGSYIADGFPVIKYYAKGTGFCYSPPIQGSTIPRARALSKYKIY